MRKPKVYVDKSNIAGDGLFASQDIKKGEKIGTAHVNGQPTPVVGKKHNHSEKPNMVSKKKGNIRDVHAKRNIRKGEELTTDYRMQPELEQPEDFQDGGWLDTYDKGGSFYSDRENIYRPIYQNGGKTKKKDNILTYANAKDYFDSHAVYTKPGQSDPKFNDMIRKKVYAGTHGYDPETETLYKLDKPVKVSERDRYLASEQASIDGEKKAKELADKRDKERTETVNIAQEETYRPHYTYDGQDLYDMAGKSVKMTPEDAKKYRQAMVSRNMEDAVKHPIFQAPGMIYSAAIAPAAALMTGAPGVIESGKNIVQGEGSAMDYANLALTAAGIKGVAPGAKNLVSKVASKVDKKIFPTRAYRVELPGGNQLSYAENELAKKVAQQGDWATKSLPEVYDYATKRGLLKGQDINLTEYKVPFWKKNIKSNKDVVALKHSQGYDDIDINPNEYIIPKNSLFYPRRTTTIKGVPEHLKADGLYQEGSIPFHGSSYQYASQPYKYIEDQINAITGHDMPRTYNFNPSMPDAQVPFYNWTQPQFAPNPGVGTFKKEGGWLDDYQEGGNYIFRIPEENTTSTTPEYPINPMSLTQDSKNQTLKEGKKEAEDWLSNWYSQRANLPQFTDLANRRKKAIDKRYFGFDTMPKDEPGTAMYWKGKIFTRPNDPYSSSSATLLHEFTHGLDDKTPQDYQESLTRKNFIPEKEWLKTESGKKFGKNKNFNYKYFTDPSEGRARLNTFRRRYNIDPSKTYTADEMKSIIENYRSYNKEGMPSRSKDSDTDIDTLFDIIGDDPARLAELNNTIVGNTPTQQQPTAKEGGWLEAYQEGGENENYNMERALELGYEPDETGHWPSVDSETGMWLKSKKHPTAWMEYMHGQLNPEIANEYNVVANPEGYFGEDQLQYVPKQKKGGSTPSNSKLYGKVLREAKKKFKVWPNPFATAWVNAEYKRRGGDYNFDMKWEYGRGGGTPPDPETARDMLQAGTAHGHPLTARQKAYLAQIAGTDEEGNYIDDEGNLTDEYGNIIQQNEEESLDADEQAAEKADTYERGGAVPENRYKVPTQVHSRGYEPFNQRK